MMTSPNFRKTTSELGVLLRHWRDVRGKSQLDLSLDTGAEASSMDDGVVGAGKASLLNASLLEGRGAQYQEEAAPLCRNV